MCQQNRQQAFVEIYMKTMLTLKHLRNLEFTNIRKADQLNQEMKDKLQFEN